MSLTLSTCLVAVNKSRKLAMYDFRMPAMTELLLELSTRAQTLSSEERAQLSEMLLDSLDGEIANDLSPAWEREIERRVAAYDRGEIMTYAAEDVFAEARRLAK